MIRLPLNADGDLPSQFTRALVGRAIDIAAPKADDAHLYSALASSWRATGDAASDFVVALRDIQALRPDVDFAPEDLARTFKTLIYAATETFDIYHALIPKRLERGRAKAETKVVQAYKDTIKHRRDPVANMCNAMKHGARTIVPARIVFNATGKTTFVYRINVGYGDLQQADAAVHRDGAFASFERTAHEIIHGLLRADHRAGQLAGELGENADEPITLTGPTRLNLASVLRDLTGHTPIVASSETGRFDGVTRDDDDIVLTRVAAQKVPEPTTRTMRMVVDEVARKMQLML